MVSSKFSVGSKHQCNRCHNFDGLSREEGKISCGVAGHVIPVLKKDTGGKFERCPHRGGLTTRPILGEGLLVTISQRQLSTSQLKLIAAVARNSGREEADKVENTLRNSRSLEPVSEPLTT